MKMFENIASGYKKIAVSIAIVAFLAIMYFALIPGGTVAATSFVSAMSGTPIVGAFVKIVEWPQYNATTDSNGNYTINNMPIGNYNLSAWAQGYVRNTQPITVVTGNNVNNFALSPNANISGYNWISWYDSNGQITASMGTLFPRPIDIGNTFFGEYDSEWAAYGWYSVFLVSDINGTGANLNVTYYYENGTLFTTDNTKNVTANGTTSWVPGSCNPPDPSCGLLRGSVKIVSSNPVVIEKRIAAYVPGTFTTTGSMSVLMPEKKSAGEVFYGNYYSHKVDQGWFSVILISDANGTGANTNISYYYSNNGTFYAKEDLIVPANGVNITVPGSTAVSSGLPDGNIKIMSDKPVVVEKRIAYYYPYNTWNAGDLMAANLLQPSDATREMIVPVYDSTMSANGTGWYSVVLLTDVLGTGATVTVDYLFINGTRNNTVTYSVPINGTATIIPGSDGPSYGKMLIHSNNPIIGEERMSSYLPGWVTKACLAYNIPKATEASLNAEIANYFSLYGWISEGVISSTNGASSPTLYYYNATGVMDHTEYIDIPVNGSYVFYPGDVNMGRLTQGKVMIKGST